MEHAREQNIKLPNIFSKFSPSSGGTNAAGNTKHLRQKLESIDKYLEEEDDVPIIIRNLHSVKSLKHFFEIRTKSLLTELGSPNHVCEIKKQTSINFNEIRFL